MLEIERESNTLQSVENLLWRQL